MRNRRLEQMASSLYDKNLPYHNFQHALFAVREGQIIVRLCQKDGIRIDEEAIYYALLFHDAGYHEDHQAKGFDTKEEYAASLAADVLISEELDEELVEHVKDLIRCTHPDAKVNTIEEKAVRAADLAGVAAEYNEFRKNTEKLRREQEMLTGRLIPWNKWKESVVETLKLYLRQDIEFAIHGNHGGGPTSFLERAEMNLARLVVDEQQPGRLTN